MKTTVRIDRLTDRPNFKSSAMKGVADFASVAAAEEVEKVADYA